MTSGERQRLCLWLRGQPVPSTQPQAEIIGAARRDGVWLLIADRLRLTEWTDDLRQAAVVEAIRARELRAVLVALCDRGVRPVLLKGAALAYTHYARPELRPRSDTDLMIPFDARDAVARVLVNAGYHRPPELDGDVAIGQFHFIRTDEHGCTHALDVHWRVSNVRVFAEVLTYDELARDAVPIRSLGPHAASPSAVHALLIACVHRVAHHADAPNLLWLYDVHLIATQLTQDERDAFTALASERRILAVCARTLALADEAFGEIDAGWTRSLRPSEGRHEPTAAFIGGELRQLDIFKSDLAATAWTSRLQLVWEHLFPPPSYIRQRFPRWPPILLPLAYARRIVAGAPRWLRR